MRLLIDEALSQRVAGLLTSAGHDCVHVAELGLLGEPDERIMAAAAVDDRVVVSLDTDFGQMLALGRYAGPSILLLRKAPRTADRQAAVVLAALAQAEEALLSGAIAVVVADRIRLRLLPITE